MADVVVLAYLLGWGLTTLGLVVASRWLQHRWSPPPHPVAVSFLAGGLWPLLLLGAIQFGGLAAGSKVAAESGPHIAVIV